MSEKKTIERAKRDKREGKSPSTQAGEFVREEIEHVRQGKHGARSTQQAIAIGLSEARRAGVDLPPPKKDKASSETIKRAKREGRSAASKQALSKHARKSARKRSAGERSAAAKKAARTRAKNRKRT